MEEEGMTYVQDPHIMNLNLHPVYPNETENMGEPRLHNQIRDGFNPHFSIYCTPLVCPRQPFLPIATTTLFSLSIDATPPEQPSRNSIFACSASQPISPLVNAAPVHTDIDGVSNPTERTCVR